METLAAQKNQSVESFIETMLDERQPSFKENGDDNPMAGLISIITAEDTQLTDLSTTIRDTLRDTVPSGYVFSLKDKHDSD
jgi:hypothetical protein